MGNKVELRTWSRADVPRLARLANEREIWDQVRDEFPHPFTERDAEAYVREARQDGVVVSRAIVCCGELAGSISIKRNDDIRRYSGAVSYWIGRGYRGKGIATAAITEITRYALDELGLNRLYAKVFATNAASIRALEKAGYSKEGELQSAVFKNGRFLNQVVYARTGR